MMYLVVLAALPKLDPHFCCVLCKHRELGSAASLQLLYLTYETSPLWINQLMDMG